MKPAGKSGPHDNDKKGGQQSPVEEGRKGKGMGRTMRADRLAFPGGAAEAAPCKGRTGMAKGRDAEPEGGGERWER